MPSLSTYRAQLATTFRLVVFGAFVGCASGDDQDVQCGPPPCSTLLGGFGPQPEYPECEDDDDCYGGACVLEEDSCTRLCQGGNPPPGSGVSGTGSVADSGVADTGDGLGADGAEDAASGSSSGGSSGTRSETSGGAGTGGTAKGSSDGTTASSRTAEDGSDATAGSSSGST